MKSEILKGYVRRHGLKVMVETGTFLGDMVESLRNDMDHIYSIELSVDLYENACKRFARRRNVTIVQGDSGIILSSILKQINRPCLFWLDGHYSGGITACGSEETPILRELQMIHAHPLASSHVILIDDARQFRGDKYPAIKTLESLSRSAGFKTIALEQDIIRIFNPL